MGPRELPVRAVSESLFTGCSKRRSHRTLPRFQQFEIPHKFPQFPQIFGEWIVRRIRKKESGKENGHPCSKVYDTFLDCVRRHPDSFEKKCRTEAGKCLACQEEHKGWKAPEGFQYMRFLEHFRVFSEGKQSPDEGVGKFNYTDPGPRTHGVGTVLEFGKRLGGYYTKPTDNSGKAQSGAAEKVSPQSAEAKTPSEKPPKTSSSE
ncbi:unnamed protein product [Polarella glacialis]|uniref:Uncharacterized protein n=1 Tax=Polarella glacialis TaxID=89957 RepID=A0A813JUI1_POLGL|nr:unnamed protein product [Polarella glacialis]